MLFWEWVPNLVPLSQEQFRSRIPAPTGNREMPNFLVIGAAKCGTTSLNRYLDLHPQISMAKLKEPKYFVRQVAPGFLRDFPEFAGLHISNRDDYLGLFEPGTDLRGESSTAYSSFPQFPGVPAAIHAEVARMKMVYLVRDPVNRVISQFVQWLSSTSSYRRGIARSRGFEGLLRESHDCGPNLLSGSMYMTQIEEYLRYFPPESLLVVDQADLESDRRRTLSRIFSFIGADPDFWDDSMLKRANEGFRKREMSSAYMSLRTSKPVRGALDLLPEAARTTAVAGARRILSKPIERPVLQPWLRQEVEGVLADEVSALREFTGMDFPTWSV